MAKLLGLIFAAVVFLGLSSLGVWQLQRLAWKLDLIETVEAGLAAPATPLPPRQDWPALAESGEYRKLQLSGTYLPGQEVRVQALSSLGQGVWQVVPFQTSEGVVLVTRGFIPEDQKTAAFPAPEGEQNIIGLLRHDQPGGAFLRDNDPQNGRWFSRDIGQISASLGLSDTAPWFLDLGVPGIIDPAAPAPVEGLTVVKFRNPHIGYAVTWFGLAAAWAAMIFYLPRLKPRSADLD